MAEKSNVLESSDLNLHKMALNHVRFPNELVEEEGK